jgi:hypothetical protein
MAEVVLVHGIAQEQLAAATLEQQWVPALAGGVANYGDQVLADRIWRSGTSAIDIRMGYYATPFIDKDAQGSGGPDRQQLSEEAEQLTEELALAWLRAAAQCAADPRDRTQAQKALNILAADPNDAQGRIRTAVGRPTLNALAGLRWFAPFGMTVASKFVWRALSQVTRYLTDDEIRSYAQDQVLHWIGPDTRLLIGHSLGSVVAYETLHRAYEAGHLPPSHCLTLITLGSPLGLDGIVYNRLHPQPPHVPPAAHRWDNFAAPDDLVAAHLSLLTLFPPAMGASVSVTDHPNLDTGSKPHQIEHYLTKPSVGKVVSETLNHN